MAAYRRVYDSRHLQADCQEPGSAPEPYARQSSMDNLYLLPLHGVCVLTADAVCCKLSLTATRRRRQSIVRYRARDEAVRQQLHGGDNNVRRRNCSGCVQITETADRPEQMFHAATTQTQR